MENKFYEEECLPRVKSIAEDINWLYQNAFDRDEARERIEELDMKAVDDEEGLDEDEQEELAELREKLEEADRIGAGDLYEYFSDALDEEYIVGSDGELRGVIVWVGLGGPSICVDTYRQEVRLTWGSDRATWSLWSDVTGAIDEIFEDRFRCVMDSKRGW